MAEGGTLPAQAIAEGLPPIQLYNMETDLSETANRVDRYPEVVAKLLAELETDVAHGRGTPGAPQANDVEIDLLEGGSVPKIGNA